MDEKEDRVIGYREDTGEPIYQSDSDKALAKIREEKTPSLLNYVRGKIRKKEQPTVNETEAETKPEAEDPKQLPEPTAEEETAIEPAEKAMFDLVRRKGLELELIREFELRPKVDYYEIAGKKIFTKEGLSKFMPFILINGFKISYKVVEVVDEPNYKYVRVRAFLGPETQPIQLAEGGCDWREETSWQETISEKIAKTLRAENEGKQIDPRRALKPEDIQYDSENGKVTFIDPTKQFYIAYDHLQKRKFALRVTEGKAIRRAFSHLTGLSSATKKEIDTIEAEARVLHETE